MKTILFIFFFLLPSILIIGALELSNRNKWFENIVDKYLQLDKDEDVDDDLAPKRLFKCVLFVFISVAIGVVGCCLVLLYYP